jgi:hypothetical protein
VLIRPKSWQRHGLKPWIDAAKKRLQLRRLGGDELHCRPLYRLGNQLCVTEVVLLSLRIGAEVLCRHQPCIMAKRLQPAAEMMGADAGLHADQTGLQVRKACFNPATRPFLMQHNGAALIEANDVERVLANIDADEGIPALCFCMGCGRTLGRRGDLCLPSKRGVLSMIRP